MGLKDWIKKKAAEVAEEDKERKMRLERDIIMALRQVYDPEIPVNVYDLGLIYEVKVDDVITLTLGARQLSAQVVSIQETVAKNDASMLYKIL